MLTSSSRLDLGITVGPKKPGGIKKVLSSHWPIIFDYRLIYGELTGSVLWRMRAALRHHHDRVRDITFEGSADDFDEFFKVTKCTFPVLESLSLRIKYCGNVVPDTFLGGPDLSYLHLRRLTLHDFSFASISRFLSSGTFLTDLCLSTRMDTAVSSSAAASLLACLQGMPCLRKLHLFILRDIPDSRSQPSTPEDIVPLSKLKIFRYNGPSLLLNALVAGLSAPSLRDVWFNFCDDLCPPFVHLPRFIDNIEEHHHAVEADFLQWGFRLLLLTQSEYIMRRKPCFELFIDLRYHRVSIMRMNGALSTRLATIEELRLTIASVVWVDDILWRRFYQQFPSVKALRTEGANNAYWIARTLHQGHGEPGDLSFLPALEEIDLGRGSLTDESEQESQLACFEPFVSARQQAGRPVRVFFSP